MYKKHGIAVCITAFILVIYIQVLGFEFLNLDDPIHLGSNPHLNGQAPFLTLWKLPYKRLYIPLTYSIWGGLYQLTEAPWAFHLLNVLLHALTSVCLVFPLIRRTYGKQAAIWGTLFFALHPLQVEAVAWVSGFKDVLSGTLLFLALWLFVEGSDNKKDLQGSFLSASLFCALLAALAKPAAVMFPLLAWVLSPRLSRKQAATLALSVILALPLALITSHAQAQQGFLFTPAPLWQRPLVALDALGFYLSKVFFPFGLVLDYGRTPASLFRDPSTVLFVALSSVALALATVPSYALRPWRSGALFFSLALLPVLGLKPFVYQTTSTVSDRYAYAALFGMALALAPFFANPRRRFLVASCCVIVFLGTLTFLQTQRWKNNFTLFHYVVSKNPASWLAYNNLASAYETAGDLENARHFYERSIKIHPHVPGFNSLGIVSIEMNKPREAVDWLRKGLAAGFEDARLYNNLGTAWMQLGDAKRAESAFLRALELESMDITYQNLRRLRNENGG
ncbi:MAG: tetratricopeptide repeat protein [Bdellovibrionales bacterium]|nr:tetratricopeptide repeat protein [Bdellovibrionales bacterium]